MFDLEAVALVAFDQFNLRLWIEQGCQQVTEDDGPADQVETIGSVGTSLRSQQKLELRAYSKLVGGFYRISGTGPTEPSVRSRLGPHSTWGIQAMEEQLGLWLEPSATGMPTMSDAPVKSYICFVSQYVMSCFDGRCGLGP